MRGSISRDDAWAMSYLEREKMISFINDRFKDAEKLISKNVSVFL